MLVCRRWAGDRVRKAGRRTSPFGLESIPPHQGVVYKGSIIPDIWSSSKGPVRFNPDLDCIGTMISREGFALDLH